MAQSIYDLMKSNRIIAVGPDGIRRGKNFDLMSQYEIDLDQAIENGLWWLSDKGNRDAMAELRREYILKKGWSEKRTFKSERKIPLEMWLSLPKRMRAKEGAKELRSFIKKYFPALELSYSG